MIQTLVATQFLRFMTSGRTSPALFGCEDGREVVVKLFGSIEKRGSFNEIVGAKLAEYFAMTTPLSIFVHLEPELVQLIAEAYTEKASMLQASIGVNFGTQLLVGGSTWPVDRTVPVVMQQSAVEIFAFDALIQNPDRRYNNPNLLAKSDSFTIFDHELAFSFQLEIFPSPTPWLLEAQTYLRDHVFYRALKSQTIDLNEFRDRLRNLSDALLLDILADVPPEWENGYGQKVLEHLGLVRDHADEFVDEVRRIVA